MFSVTSWIGYACIFMRMTGCILLNPIIGRKNIPAYFRAGMILTFSLLVIAYETPSVAANPDLLTLTIILLCEFFVGFVIGFVVTLFSYVIILGGQLMDLQMGLSMSSIYDPQSNISMSISATYYNIMFIFLFFAVNGHLTLIRLFLTSGDIVPYGQVAILGDVGDAMLQLFLLCTELAIKLAIPILGIQLLVEICVGILMKAIPQINVFVINLQLKIAIGILTIIFVFSPLASFLDQLVVTMLQSVEDIMHLM